MFRSDRRSLLAGLAAAPLGLPAGASARSQAHARTVPSPTGGAPIAQADPALLRLADRWTFDGWAGPPVGVYSWVPPGAGRDVPVLLVLHGVNRDADRYFTQWLPVAAAHGIAIVVPEYDAVHFPRAINYNQGRIFDADGQLLAQDQWVFGTLDGLFTAFTGRTGLAAQTYQLFGHSAGSQFVHRALLAAPPQLVGRTVAANAGFYTWPALDRAWPHGLGGTPFGEAHLRAWLARDMVVQLGTADNDPQHRSLNREPPSMLQGAHRLARGDAFFEAGRDLAATRGWRFGWTRRYVDGVDHDNARMAPHAASLLYGPPRGQSGGRSG